MPTRTSESTEQQVTCPHCYRSYTLAALRALPSHRVVPDMANDDAAVLLEVAECECAPVHGRASLSVVFAYQPEEPVAILRPEESLANVLRGAAKLDGRECLAIGRSALGSDARAA